MNQSINVRLFGAFRQGNPESSLTVEIPEGGRVTDLRQAMDSALPNDNARSLLKASAFATDSAVLDDNDVVPNGEISILPPVCGG
jgi:molybdopterin synthase sulfur carrier subunit